MSKVHKLKNKREKVGREQNANLRTCQVRTGGAAQGATESEGSWGEHKTVEAGCLVRGKTSSVPEYHPSWQVQIDTSFPCGPMGL